MVYKMPAKNPFTKYKTLKLRKIKVVQNKLTNIMEISNQLYYSNLLKIIKNNNKKPQNILYNIIKKVIATILNIFANDNNMEEVAHKLNNFL